MSNPTELPDLDKAGFETWWEGRGLPEQLQAAFFMVWRAALEYSRAQPEGEAPQAARGSFAEFMHPNVDDLAATLSPLCGVQHAESGPVAWVYECRQPGDDKNNWAEFFSRNKPSDEPYIRNVRPLYAQLDGGQEGSESNG